MAADHKLLDAVLFNTEVDNKVVSNIVGSLDCEIRETGQGTFVSRFIAYHIAARSGGLSSASSVTVSESHIGLP